MNGISALMKVTVYWPQIAFLDFISSPSLWLSLPASLLLKVFVNVLAFPQIVTELPFLSYFPKFTYAWPFLLGFKNCLLGGFSPSSTPSCWLISIKARWRPSYFCSYVLLHYCLDKVVSISVSPEGKRELCAQRTLSKCLLNKWVW